MNDEEFRDVCAMLAMNGYMSKMACNPNDSGDICEEGVFASNNAEAIAKASYIIADAMLEARNPSDEEGIAIIKKRKYVRKN